MIVSFAIIVTCLIFSAFFSGMEIAYLSANKIHLEIEKKQQGVIAKILAKITQKPSKFLTTMLVGNNIALVLYGFKTGEMLSALLPISMQGVLWQTLISTVVILLTAEFLPKVFFQIYANTLIRVFSPVAYVFYVIFTPFSEFIIWILDIILRIFFKTKGDSLQLTFSKLELEDYISEQMEYVENQEEVDAEVQIFQNALGFSQLKAREVMIPRTEIIAIAVSESVETLSKMFVESGFSKIIVFKESLDDIIGYVHSFEMFKRPTSIGRVLRPTLYVPETMLISEVLDMLTKKRKSIAVVIDEYGGTAGIITLEDIIEELFGEIEDEHDTDDFIEQKVSDNEYLLSARLEVDYLNEAYKLNIPESENYETLGGFIVNACGDIPQQGQELHIMSFRFIIEEVSQTRIVTVRVFTDQEL